MKLSCLISSLCLLLSPVIARSQTGCEYFPLTPGSSITYRVNNITASYSAASCQLSVVTRIPATVNGVQTITAFPFKDPSTNPGPLYQEVYTIGAAPASCSIPDLSQSLVEGAFAPTGFWYIGEYTNYAGGVCIPAEAKLPVNPVGGERINMHSKVVSLGGIQYDDFHWSYATIGHFPTWANYKDCWWTSLVEYDGAGNVASAYNYVFSKGIGMVAFWAIQPPSGSQASGQLQQGSGVEYLAVSWKGQ